MWSVTDYSNFTPNTDVGGGYMSSSAGTPAKKTSNQGSLLPCTCAEVIGATQDGDKFVSAAGVDFTQVTVVGVVRSVNVSATRIDYEIDDYTGPLLQVKLFVDDDDIMPDGMKTRPLRELTYLRAYGHVRSFQGARNIVAFKVIPLTDMNEVTTHILEIIYSRMLAAKAKAEDASSVTGTTMSSIGGSTSIPVNAGGLSALQNQILSNVRGYPSERGISVIQICEKLRGVPERQIREDLDFLSAEGHVYSTIDDDHFRATEA